MRAPPARFQFQQSSLEPFVYPCASALKSKSSLSSPRDPRSHTFHHLHHFFRRHHGRVPRCRHCQRSVRRSTLHTPLRLLPRQKPVNQPGSKRVPSPDPVKNLQILPVLLLIELSIAVTNRAPVIQRRGFCLPQSRRHHLERIIFHHFCNHLLKSLDFKRGYVLVHPRHFVAQRGRKILLVP